MDQGLFSLSSVHLFYMFCHFDCRVQGKTIDEASGLKNTDIAKHLNLPPVKLHCSMLAEDAIKVTLDTATDAAPNFGWNNSLFRPPSVISRASSKTSASNRNNFA